MLNNFMKINYNAQLLKENTFFAEEPTDKPIIEIKPTDNLEIDPIEQQKINKQEFGYEDYTDSVADWLIRKEEIKTQLNQWKSFNNALGGGFSEGSLTLVCARSGLGKTNFLIQLSKLLCTDIDKPIFHSFVSAELNKQKITERYLAYDLQVPYNALSSNKEKYKEQIQDAMVLFEKTHPIKFMYTKNIEKIAKAAKFLKAEFGVNHLFIDHIHELQLTNPTPGDKGKYSDFLKIVDIIYDLYYNHNLTIIAAAQFKTTDSTQKDFGKRTIDDISYGSELRNKASNIIYLYETKQQNKIKRLINAGKATEDDKIQCQIKFLKTRDGFEWEQTFDCNPSICSFKPSKS